MLTSMIFQMKSIVIFLDFKMKLYYYIDYSICYGFLYAIVHSLNNRWPALYFLDLSAFIEIT